MLKDLGVAFLTGVILSIAEVLACLTDHGVRARFHESPLTMLIAGGAGPALLFYAAATASRREGSLEDALREEVRETVNQRIVRRKVPSTPQG